MRLAIYHNLPSGGGKRALFEQVTRLSTHHDVDVFALNGSEHVFGDIRPYTRMHTLIDFRPLPNFRSPLGRLNQVVRLLNLRLLDRLGQDIAARIDSGGYSAVLVHTCQFENSPSILHYLRRVPAVFYCHEPLRALYEDMPARPYTRKQSRGRRLLDQVDPLPGLYQRVLRRNDQRNIRQARRVLVNSQFTRRNVQEFYQVEAQVCHPGVDTRMFRPLPIEKQEFVLSVGSLTPLKGFDFLIEALACIPASTRPRLVIASNFQNPNEKKYLVDLAHDREVLLDLRNMISDDELVILYNQAQLVVYAPHREPFGFVPLEAMACGTAVVAVCEGGVLETVKPGENGLLVERVPAVMAEAVESLLAQPERVQRLGRNGLHLAAQHWTWERSVTQLEEHLVGCTNDQAQA